jgi:HD-GYP domain-containing protein (c-di-GMP phosphodiesterase class II)
METSKLKLKKIRIDELKMDMFIVNLGRSWFSHPFLRNQLKITSEKQIQKLRKYGIQEVYIDPERGMDLPPPEIDLAGPIASVPETLTESEELTEIAPAAEEALEETKETSSPVVPLSTLDVLPLTPGGDTDVPFEQLEKPESVVYWEKNIGRVEENLTSLQAPIVAPSVEQVPYGQEIRVARVIKEEAQTVVQNIMQDVRMGRSIESDRVKRVVTNMVDSVLRNQDALVGLTRIKKYDEYTYVHSLDVCIFCVSMARHLSLPREQMIDIGIGGLLHDAGKMRIPPQILKKPERLSAEDWVEVRKHPIYSLEIMEESKGIPEPSKQLALQHHERHNGSGYPFGLKGDSIGLFGQIAGIVDFYDAITADRYYQKAIQPHEAIRQIYERSHTEFNQWVVERFIQCIGIHPFGTLVLLDTEEIGIVCAVNPETLLRPKVLVIYQNSKTPYAQPFLADLTERSDQSQSYKRSVIMPLDAQKWNIHVEAYLSEIRKNLDIQPAY